MMEPITFIDGLLIVFLLTLGWFFFRRIKIQQGIESPFYMWLFYSKIVGVVAFLFFNFLNENAGDTFMYFRGGEMLANKFYSNPLEYLLLIFSDNQLLRPYLDGICTVCGFRDDNSSIIMIKITSVFNVITYNSFWLVSILFSYISFIGTWLLYRVFEIQLGKISKLVSVIILFLPTVLFWNSGLMKDTLSFAALGVLCYGLFNRKALDWRLILIPALVLLFLKNYVLFAFFTAAGIYLIYLYATKAINNLQKIVLYLLIAMLLLVVIYEIYTGFSLTHKVFFRLKDYQTFHQMRANFGYDFGKTDYNFTHLILNLPNAIFTSLFRPFIWELPNVNMLVMAIENLLGILGIVAVVARIKMVKKVLIENPFLIFSLSLVLVLSFVIGMSAYSFGALSRYKTLMLPFYFLFLGAIFDKTKGKILKQKGIS